MLAGRTAILPEADWKRILNLLTEELEVWEQEDPVYGHITDMIVTIERQTGIRKKSVGAKDANQH